MVELPSAIADERTPNTYLCTFGGHKLCFSLCVLDCLPEFLPFQHSDSLLSNNYNNIYISVATVFDSNNNNIKTQKNSQIVKGEALSAPQRRKGSQEKKSTYHTYNIYVETIC